MRIGLVQEVVRPGQQIERALAIAREIAQCAPLALVHTIANARLAIDQGEPAAVAAIPAMSAEVRSSADFQEASRRSSNGAPRGSPVADVAG